MKHHFPLMIIMIWRNELWSKCGGNAIVLSYCRQLLTIRVGLKEDNCDLQEISIDGKSVFKLLLYSYKYFAMLNFEMKVKP